jgi:hypothetical protein
VVFLALIIGGFSHLIIFVKLEPQRHASVVTYGVCKYLWFIKTCAKFSSFLPHSMSGKIWLQVSVDYHYYMYITVGNLITWIESLSIKIVLIQEYFDSALWPLTVVVATVLTSWGSRFICRPKRSNTVPELMSSGLHSCAFIVNKYIISASTYSWYHNR